MGTGPREKTTFLRTRIGSRLAFRSALQGSDSDSELMQLVDWSALSSNRMTFGSTVCTA